MSRSQAKTRYALLGVPSDASQAEIDNAYLTMQNALADLIDPVLRQQRLTQLDEAYQLLSSPVRRAVYDASLNAGQPSLVEVISPNQRHAAGQRSQGSNTPWLIAAGLVLLGLFVCGYLYFAWRQQRAMDEYRNTLASVQKRAFEMQDKVMQAQESRMDAVIAAERDAENGSTSPVADDYQKKEAARREQEQRDREYEQWDYKKANEAQRAQYETERAERQRKQEREREARQAEMQQERDQRDTAERVERERQQMLTKLMSEQRYEDARRIAKTAYEFERIQSAEKYRR